jgi:hypothetical protein
VKELTDQKDRLERLIANVLNGEDYSKLKEIAKENVKVVLSENKKLISTAFAVMIQTLKTDPQLVNLIYVNFIYSAPTANDGEQHKDNNINIIKYLEFNKNSLLGLAEKHYENLVEAFTKNAIDIAASASSSINSTLSLPQSSSSAFPSLSNQSDTHRIEDPNVYNNKDDIAY